MAVVFTLINALFVSMSNVIGGVASRRLPVAIVVSIAGLSSVVLAVVFAAFMPGTPSSVGFVIGLVAGVFGGAGLPIAYRAFAIGPAGIAGAIIAVVTTAMITLAGLVAGDPMTPLRAIGLALCIVAILLVTYRRPVDGQRVSARGPVLAMIAALLFSGFVITINAAPEPDGMWPLVGARIGVTVVAVLFLGFTLYRRGRAITASLRARRSLVLIPIAAGALDITGNLFLVLALQAGDLVLLAILAPATPIFTAIIGRVFLRELMTRWQILGLVVASGALVLASL